MFRFIIHINTKKIKKIKFDNFEKCPIMSSSSKIFLEGAPADDVSRCPQAMTTSGSNMVPTVAIATAQCSSNDVFELLPASRKNYTEAISIIFSQNVPRYIPRRL